MSLYIWYISQDNQIIATLSSSGSGFAVAWSPNGKYIAVTANDAGELGVDEVDIWGVANAFQFLRAYTGHQSAVYSLCWPPDSRQIVSCDAVSNGGTVQIWEADTGKPFAPPYQGHRGGATSVAWSPDGRYIASAGQNDGTVQIWTPR